MTTAIMVIPLKEASLGLKAAVVLLLVYLFYRYFSRQMAKASKEKTECKVNEETADFEEMKETTVSRLEQSIETKSVRSSDLVYENITIEELIDCFLKFVEKSNAPQRKGEYEIENERGIKILISEENLIVSSLLLLEAR